MLFFLGGYNAHDSAVCDVPVRFIQVVEEDNVVPQKMTDFSVTILDFAVQTPF